MKLAAVQFRPPKGEPEVARRELGYLVETACAQGADLVVCPEMAITGYVWHSPDQIGPLTETPSGPTFQMLSELARTWGSWIVCGFAERFVHPRRRSPGEGWMASLFNSALVVMPEGQLATCYRKVLLYDADKAWASPGWRRPICRADFGRLAPAICMDINDPRFQDHLRMTRPDIVAFCTNWISEGQPVHPYWKDRLRGWEGWFVAANSWGEDSGTRFSGESAILSPDGEVVAAAGKVGDAVLVVDVEELEAELPRVAEASK